MSVKADDVVCALLDETGDSGEFDYKQDVSRQIEQERYDIVRSFLERRGLDVESWERMQGSPAGFSGHSDIYLLRVAVPEPVVSAHVPYFLDEIFRELDADPRGVYTFRNSLIMLGTHCAQIPVWFKMTSEWPL